METPLTESVEETSPALSADERRLPVTAHLDEIRRRLFVCLGAIGLGTAVCFSSAGKLIEWLKLPAGEALPVLAFFSPPEAILAYMKVAITAGLFLSMPVVLHQLWGFIRPGLSPKEGRYGLIFIVWGSLLFLVGGAFAYWVLLPTSLPFLLGFGGSQLVAVISVSLYLSFTAAILIVCGIVFQLPLVVYLLAKMGLVRPRMLRQMWRHAVVVMAVSAALLTPTTDIATMLLMTMPMLVLYEVSIWIAAAVAPKRNQDD